MGPIAGPIVVGTSSWADPGFVREWYPAGLPARERLPWYARHFRAVELNSSFYAVPDRTTVRRWVDDTPPGFRFDVKVHRALSRHAAPLESLPPDLRGHAELAGRGRVLLTPELERALARRLREEVEPLAEAGRLGAFLVQLTPAFAPGRHRLEELDDLLEQLAPVPVAVELRHRGWLREGRIEETLGWYSERGAAFVGVDAPLADAPTIMPPLDAVTRDELAYLRAHGRNERGYLTGRSVAERFGWRYTDDELREIGARARALAERAGEVHVMFNNNRGDDAPTAAQRFATLLGLRPVPPPPDPQLRLGWA